MTCYVQQSVYLCGSPIGPSNRRRRLFEMEDAEWLTRRALG
jgi:hypothetical protein